LAFLIFWLSIEPLAEYAVEQPPAAHVVSVDNASVSELDALARVVYPGKIDVQGSLENAEDDGHGVGLRIRRIETPPNPVEKVERAIRAESKDVARVNHRGDGCLAKKEELRKHAYRLKNLREIPNPLQQWVSVTGP
jgi:hypothetical protein